MENTKHLYIVSFGDSKQYRIEVSDDKVNGVAKDTRLVQFENELNEYLKQEFPEGTFAFYTTPKVTEISEAHRDQFESYPPLNEEAVDEIKKVLVKEVKVMTADKQLNDNAPWNTVPA